MKILAFTIVAAFSLNAFAAYKNGMVVSEQKLASAAGIEILRKGGNAIDAAVAVGYALAVVDSCCGNIGGGGFMTIHLANGNNIFVNFREKAPLKATRTMFENTDENSTTLGYLAVGVPGTVLGLETVLKKYGTMTRQQVMAPAIMLAEKGYRVSAYQANQFAEYQNDFIKQPNIAAIFLKNGKTYGAGDLLVQKDLAHTLKSIAQQGTDVFYKGSVADKIVAASNKNNGILSLNDFKQYSIEILKPIICTYKGYTVISSAPPSSGGITLCEILNILENFSLHQYGRGKPNAIRITVEAMRHGFYDRNSKLGDPNFVNNPIHQLNSKAYAKQLSEKIRAFTPNKTLDKELKIPELPDTTHYSVLDKKGNAVSVTYTLNGFFGALIMAENTGFFLNNEMDDFATRAGMPNKFGLVQSDENAIAAGKRPLSSMTPTIVLKNNKVFMVLGSPGGPRIITSVLQTILNVLEYDLSLQQAVDAPRIHYQGLPDLIYPEQGALDIYTQIMLEYWNYNIAPVDKWSAVEAIMIDPKTNTVTGANDIRRPDGAALKY